MIYLHLNIDRKSTPQEQYRFIFETNVCREYGDVLIVAENLNY